MKFSSGSALFAKTKVSIRGDGKALDLKVKGMQLQTADKVYIQVNLPISKSKGMAKYFKLSEVQNKQNVTSSEFDVHVPVLQDTLLQYMCSKTVPTENRIEMKTKEIHLSLFYSILFTLWTAIMPLPLRGINNISETVIL